MSVRDSTMRERPWGSQARLAKDITLEEYMYWAKIEREIEEIEFQDHKASHGTILGSARNYAKNLFGKRQHGNTQVRRGNLGLSDEARNQLPQIYHGTESSSQPLGVSANDLEAEWRTAARALRTASWGGVFYLITTDVLGWPQAPYALANTGYGLGLGMYVLFALAAAASGWMIWKTFMALDSTRYPVMTFSDPFFRLFGPTTRHFIAFMQGLQIFFTVCIIQLSQTNIIAQLGNKTNICFVVCGTIVLVVGIVSGYIRSLRYLSWLTYASVWINVCAFVITCVAAALYGADPAAQVNSGILPKAWATNPAPVKTFVGVPKALYQPTNADIFGAELIGINSTVYAYSGAVLFIAFMAEMRHPADFWKAVFLAQCFVCVVYSFFGSFAYTYYGQYSFGLVNQVVQPRSLSVVVNTLTLVTGWIAVFLYFNVGLKAIYVEVGQELLGAPDITTKIGKYVWWSIGTFYWIFAFVVAMSIPQFNAFVNLVGALFGLNFTYSLSGIMFAGMMIQKYSALPGEGFDPSSGVTIRHDRGPKRWIRGLLNGWYWSLPAIIYASCGLASSGMGSWAAIKALISAFGPGGSVTTSWHCTNPFHTGS